MFTKPQKPAKDRRVFIKPTPVRVVSATKSGSVLTMTFNQAVTLRRGEVPQYTTNVAGADPLSAELANPTTLLVTFDAAITTATTVTIPPTDPAIRSQNGGFVADTTFPVS